MRVKIVKASYPGIWYSDSIGQEFDVLGIQTSVLEIGKKCYLVRSQEMTGETYTNFIKEEDCVICQKTL